MEENNILEFDMQDTEGEIDYSESIITMTGENGEEVNFLFLDLVEYEGKNYAVMVEFVDGRPEEQAVILEVVPAESEDEEETYEGVDDEEILSEVFAIFEEHSSFVEGLEGMLEAIEDIEQLPDEE